MHVFALRAVPATAVAVGLVLSAASARGETVNCTPVTSVPTTIAASGVYCLTTDLDTSMTSGNAITIAANNVILDLNGHKLGGLAAGPATDAMGVYAMERQNVTVRNGTIRGFGRAVFLDGAILSQGHVIEGIRADQNTIAGFLVKGRGIIIRRNQVVATGGSTLNGPGSVPTGIVAFGDGIRIVDNDVITVTKVGTAGTAWGILSELSTNVLVEDNRITSADVGLELFATTGKYRRNLTSGVATPYLPGVSTDAGNNN